MVKEKPTARSQAVIGVDLGTQSTKAAIVTLDGRPLVEASVPVEVVRPRTGWAEQDARVLEDSTLTAIERALATAPDGCEVLALAFSGQMGGVIGIDEAFNPVTPHESWMDTRADEDRRAVLAIAGEKILDANGIIPFVGPRVRRWLRETPSLADRLARVVAPVGYVGGRLTGAQADGAVCDRTQAPHWGCFDARADAWDFDLAQLIGLPSHLLPRLVESTEIIGRLTRDAAIRCGLPPGLPVAAGIGDGNAGWLAGGGVKPGTCVESSGTSLNLAMTIDSFTPDPNDVLTCMPSPISGLWYLLGFTSGTGATHRWLAELLAGGNYDQLEQAGSTIAPGSAGLFSVPHLHGRATPFEPEVRGAFIGFDENTSAAHFYRALLESLAIEIATWVHEAQRILPAMALSSVACIGGGAQSALWTRIKADVIGIPYARMHPFVNAARGAALVAAAAVRAVRLDDPAWHDPDLTVAACYEPDTTTAPAYAELAVTYQLLHTSMAPTYQHLAEAQTTIAGT